MKLKKLFKSKKGIAPLLVLGIIIALGLIIGSYGLGKGWFGGEQDDPFGLYTLAKQEISSNEPDLEYWVFDCSNSRIRLTTETTSYPNVLQCSDSCIEMYPDELSPPYPESDYVFVGKGGPSPELVGLNLCTNGQLIDNKSSFVWQWYYWIILAVLIYFSYTSGILVKLFGLLAI